MIIHLVKTVAMISYQKLNPYWTLRGIPLLLMLISVQNKQNVFCQAQARTLITRQPQDQKIIRGSTVTFYCGVSHDPNIEVLSIDSIDLDDEDGKNPPVNTIKNATFIRNVVGLSFDYDNEIIFYSDILRSDIQAVSFDRTNIQVVVGDVGPVEGLAFEKVNGDIYWTSYTYSSISKINVCDALSKKTREPDVIVHMSEHDHPRAIVVDSCLELIYWTNWNNKKPRIQRSKLTGEEVEDIIVKDIVTPIGLAIDHIAEKVYWSDSRLGKIERCDMDGSNRVIIVTSKPLHSFSIAVYDTYLFWTDWAHRAVIRANKYDGTGVVKIRDNLDRHPMGIIVVAKESDNCMINKCYGDNYGCQDRCYTDSSGQAFYLCTYGNLQFRVFLLCVFLHLYLST